MNNHDAPDSEQPLVLDLTAQEPIPAEGVRRVMGLLESGKLHRYGESDGRPSEVSALEDAFARMLGVRYCVAMNSCGATLFAALRALGIGPDDTVLANCFTLAPVPGAIAHAGARALLIDCTDDYLIDLDDLERKAGSGVSRTLLLSHMRGHICDMERLMAICVRHDLTVIEDCAHTMGAAWNGKATGTWGRVGCFSLQTYKHANAGEGGLMVTDDQDIAAQAILLSGSYMLYGTHRSRPDDAVFERWKYRTPNCSLRMSNLAAAVARPQLGAVLEERARCWNRRHDRLAAGLSGIPHILVPQRDAREQYVASSIQFSLRDMSRTRMRRFIERCAACGLHIKWFGADEPVGFTSVWTHWRYFDRPQSLPNAERVLAGLCDIRIPLTLTDVDIDGMIRVIRGAIHQAMSN